MSQQENMPTMIIEAYEGRTVEQKRGLVKDITDAVCRNFTVPLDSVTIFIHEGKKENRGKAGSLLSTEASKPFKFLSFERLSSMTPMAEF